MTFSFGRLFLVMIPLLGVVFLKFEKYQDRQGKMIEWLACDYHKLAKYCSVINRFIVRSI